ncbi:MAG: peptide chain release factor N(5)-glutamine methyltransferase [Pseudomonadales bacterium]
MTIKAALDNVQKQFAEISSSPKLDAELLLAEALEVERSHLFAWPEKELDYAASKRFGVLVERRISGQPVAYLLGQQEFWSHCLSVGPGVLIPRADTEVLVEVALELGSELTQTLNLALDSGSESERRVCVADLGTGSGAVVCSLASEQAQWRLWAVDQSAQALDYAQRNVAALGLANVTVLASNWFSALQGKRFDLIVSNPPYIAADDQHLQAGDLRFEPMEALASGDDGLDDIRSIVDQSPGYLNSGGWLVLEHGYEQASSVAELLRARGYSDLRHRCDLAGHQRVSYGCWRS